jgi:hypothetical protein
MGQYRSMDGVLVRRESILNSTLPLYRMNVNMHHVYLLHHAHMISMGLAKMG